MAVGTMDRSKRRLVKEQIAKQNQKTQKHQRRKGQEEGH